ncbi:MAG TPA: low affinity iron permease family protein [Aggregatilineaceae bacterium]|nr:low affinity iron permease family protein [Aggregatilineaceae bacterium]
MREFFRKFSQRTAQAVGSPWAFLIAVLVILMWGITGPLFNFSDTWQLVINTATTVVTFLMVFLIQNTQNRDARAMHLKLDELIRSLSSARNAIIDLEDSPDQDIAVLKDEFQKLREEERLRPAKSSDDSLAE